METKVLEIENLKEQIYELQVDSRSCLLKNIDLKRQIAMLQDGFEYQKDMADTYAKVLKEIYNWIEELADEEDIIQADLIKIKNLIPETALRR